MKYRCADNKLWHPQIKTFMLHQNLSLSVLSEYPRDWLKMSSCYIQWTTKAELADFHLFVHLHCLDFVSILVNYGTAHFKMETNHRIEAEAIQPFPCRWDCIQSLFGHVWLPIFLGYKGNQSVVYCQESAWGFDLLLCSVFQNVKCKVFNLMRVLLVVAISIYVIPYQLIKQGWGVVQSWSLTLWQHHTSCYHLKHDEYCAKILYIQNRKRISKNQIFLTWSMPFSLQNYWTYC